MITKMHQIHNHKPDSVHSFTDLFSHMNNYIYGPNCQEEQQDNEESMAQMYLNQYPLHPGFVEKYQLCDELGNGGFGFVCTGKRKLDGMNVAVKFIFKNKVSSFCYDHQLGVVPFEVYIVKNLNHKNLIDFVDYFEDAEFFYYLIMELHGMSWQSSNSLKQLLLARSTSITRHLPLIDHGVDLLIPNHSVLEKPSVQRSMTCVPQFNRCTFTSLYQRPAPKLGRRHSMDLFECIETQSKLSESVVRYIFRQVAEAVEILARFNVVHRDIKDENIVVDQNFHVKLIDFGSASFLPKEGKYFDRFAGTVKYCPPEILKGEKYCGPEQEIWSLGVLLYTMLFSEPPFLDPKSTVHGQVYIPPKSVRAGAYANNPPVSTMLLRKLFGYSDAVADLLLLLLSRNVYDRPTIQAVLQHPWVACTPQFV